MIVNLRRYRGFIVRNALSDARHRYAGSAVGVPWNVSNPLAQIPTYSLVFSQIMTARVPGARPGAGFALHLCAGLLQERAPRTTAARPCPQPSSHSPMRRRWAKRSRQVSGVD